MSYNAKSKVHKIKHALREYREKSYTCLNKIILDAQNNKNKNRGSVFQ